MGDEHNDIQNHESDHLNIRYRVSPIRSMEKVKDMSPLIHVDRDDRATVRLFSNSNHIILGGKNTYHSIILGDTDDDAEDTRYDELKNETQ